MRGKGPFYRPIAKAIAVGQIISSVILVLETQRAGPGKKVGDTPTKEALAQWEPLRPQLAEHILPHLDAYDQRP